MMGLVLFFFSSRRRHTRYIGDWSSDVCSSDLSSSPHRATQSKQRLVDTRLARMMAGERSEERRVGKECRSGRSPYREKKKKRFAGERNDDHESHFERAETHDTTVSSYL